jgi:glycosyltransferase involved in cell wall biosynthesis
VYKRRVVNNKSISCIVITNGLTNRFLIERTLSSILTTTDKIDWDVEIIVVDNSLKQNVKTKVTNEKIKVITSLPNHLPKAFNLGVKTATKKYIALFHDDCTINDMLWVEKMVNKLSDSVYIVGVEEHTNAKPYKKVISGRYIKEVPLVMEKSCFNEIGGYDETYYWGFEDVMLCNSVYKLGKEVIVLDIEHTHFNGLSTMAILTKDGLTKDLETTIVGLTDESEFRQLKKEVLGTIKVNTSKILNNRWLRRAMSVVTLFKPMEMTRGLGTNLGYSKCFEYWGTYDIPTEVIVGLMPKTRKDFDLLLTDIKYGMDGELYSKLNKHKGQLFMEYFK